jgi:uncharacterized protein
MSSRFSPLSPLALDVRQLAHSAERLQGQTPLSEWARWQQGLPEAPAQAEPLSLAWEASAEFRAATGGEAQLWLHVRASGCVPQVCQRCLAVYLEPLEIDRWFRLVADEATAEAEDDRCEEDLLAGASSLNLLTVLEDELILSLPLVPMHPVCPEALPMPRDDTGLAHQKPNPFAALSGLKTPVRSSAAGAPE